MLLARFNSTHHHQTKKGSFYLGLPFLRRVKEVAITAHVDDKPARLTARMRERSQILDLPAVVALFPQLGVAHRNQYRVLVAKLQGNARPISQA
jgi:hypothetical protein